MKVEKVVLVLGISRSSVHFVENYKVDPKPNTNNTLAIDEEEQMMLYEDNANSLTIKYRALRLLHECTQQAEAFMLSNLKPRQTKSCSIL
jgi:hypothetical protein